MDNDMYERLVEAVMHIAGDDPTFLEQIARCYAWTLTEKQAKEFLGEED